MEPEELESIAVLQAVLAADPDSTDGLVRLIHDGALAWQFLCEPEALPVFLAWAAKHAPGEDFTEVRARLDKIEFTALDAYMKAIFRAMSS